MTIEKLASIIESVLFVVSEAVELNDIQKIINDVSSEPTSKRAIKLALDHLQIKYELVNSGLSLMRIQDSYQLISKIDNNVFVERVVVKKRKKTLSQAALEVVSIIAYKQPITKLEVDEIRGVKSDSALSSLLELGLIEEVGRLDRIGRPILFGTTNYFLSQFGIDQINNLPRINQEKEKNE